MVFFSLITFNHVCSPQSLIAILKTQEFKVNHDSIHGGIGVFGYVEGYSMCAHQRLVGRGAELIVEWGGEFENLADNELPSNIAPNTLYRLGSARSVIPKHSSNTYISVVDITIHGFAFKNISIFDRCWLLYLRYKIGKKPIIVSLIT